MRSLTASIVLVALVATGLGLWLRLDYDRLHRGTAADLPPPAVVVRLAPPVSPDPEDIHAPEVKPTPRQPPAKPPKSAARYLDPALIEDSPVGPLPRIGPGGKTPAQTYARRFDPSETRPRIAIVVTDLGLQQAVTATALKALPPEVTLAFSPYGTALYSWTARARAKGHEILLQVAMQARTPDRDPPEPRALLASLPASSNTNRLNWALSRFVGYVGIVGPRNEGLSLAPRAFDPVMATLRRRGLLYVHPRPNSVTLDPPSTERSVVRLDMWLDPTPAPSEVERRMRLAEALARGRGRATVGVRAYPVTLALVRRWLATFGDEGIAAAPVSAMAANAEPEPDTKPESTPTP